MSQPNDNQGKPSNVVILVIGAVIIVAIVAVVLLAVTHATDAGAFGFISLTVVGLISTVLNYAKGEQLTQKVTQVAHKVENVERQTNGSTAALILRNTHDDERAVQTHIDSEARKVSE